MSEIRLKSIFENDMASNLSPQLMICLLVDASYSMIENHRIDIVNQGIRSFLNEGKNDLIARDALDICIIAFGGDSPKTIQDFTNVQNIHFKDIVPEGGTPLEKALRFAVQKIQDRREEWIQRGNDLYHPWLIVISDGKSDDDISGIAAIIQRMYREHKLKGKCIGVGDGSEVSDLEKVAPNHKVSRMDALELKDYFSMLSKSANRLSTSSPDEDSFDLELI